MRGPRQFKFNLKPRKSRKHRFKIKTWILILALFPLLFIDATLLRNDHVKMTELRDAVLAADLEEDSEKTVAALNTLREFTRSNIVINVVDDNGVEKITFGTGPFYLEHQYLRAANKALEEAEKNLTSDSNPHGNIYGAAGEKCRPLAIQNGWSWSDARYINCMMAEIGKYPAADELQDQVIAALPSTELYRREYASPVWAPTLTGFALLITLIVIVVIFIRFLVWVFLRLSLLFI